MSARKSLAMVRLQQQPDLFWQRTRPVGDCLEWTGPQYRKGYGVVAAGIPAHRVAYELAVGPLPSGEPIDHLCRNRLCVRPSHLEVVTLAENNRRAADAIWAERGSCAQGHPLSDVVAKRTRRVCLTCRSKSWQKYRQRRAALRTGPKPELGFFPTAVGTRSTRVPSGIGVET